MINKKINVLHVVAGDLNQGAARGAYWLHKGLLEQNINSILLNNGKLTDSNFENVVNINNFSKISRILNFIRARLDIYLKKIYSNPRKEIFSTGLFGFNFLNYKYYKEADIIHLHWINGGFLDLKIINKINKPIIWTIRDMWPFTGGCHYTLDCIKYKTKCGNCLFLNSQKEKDLSSFLFKRKMVILNENPITFVGISNWISKKAMQSTILNGHKVQTIFNNIDSKAFKYYRKELAVLELGIKTDKKIILVGAINSKNTWKGFHYLKDALNRLDRKKYCVLTFGKINPSDFDKINLEITHFGFVNDDQLLSKIYSISDVYVTTATQEAFGKTVVEAMSCKTPVVCFDNSGPADLVDHQINGYLSKSFSSSEISKGIEWIVNNPNYTQICDNASAKVLKEFDNNVIAEKYVNLYKSKLL